MARTTFNVVDALIGLAVECATAIQSRMLRMQRYLERLRELLRDLSPDSEAELTSIVLLRVRAAWNHLPSNA